ncbi:MAG: asparagine synthase (glutamine-hydrolyzing) [Parvibaculum sp.]|nr:asparagine synthase (glutamine-hydrolyzing) [Parvibaculum sp.]
MCGIAGWHQNNSLSSEEGERRIAVLGAEIKNRGPDGSGSWASNDYSTGLVHARLSILDLTDASAQPFRDEASGAIIVYNGEIYNYRELRRELRESGLQFHSDGDTEVLLAGYLRHGSAFLRRVRGMFVFAIYDPRNDSFILARDENGIKPLYVGAHDGGIFFGSTAGAVASVTLPGGSPAAAVSLAVLGCVIEPLSPWADVVAVAPGSIVTFKRNDGGLTKMVEMFARPEKGDMASPSLERLGRSLADSVAAHFVSDVPVGIFQSGGVDSSLLSTLAVEQGARPTLITIGFDEFRGTDFDEVPSASIVAKTLGLEHCAKYYSREECNELLVKYFNDMATPTVDGLNNYLASHFCRTLGLKVALSGCGGDEWTGGYPSYRQIPLASRTLKIADRVGARGAVQLLVRRLGPLIADRYPKARHAAEYLWQVRDLYLLRKSLHLPSELGGLLTHEAIDAGLDEFLGAYEDLVGAPTVADAAEVGRMESAVYLRCMLLKDADWTSMAHGVELRTPFVDTPLWSEVFPARETLRYSKSSMRALLEQRRPELAQIRKKKTGFYVPHRHWNGPDEAALSWSEGQRAWCRKVLVAKFPEYAL